MDRLPVTASSLAVDIKFYPLVAHPEGLDSNPALEAGCVYYFSLLPTVRPEERWLSASNDAETVSLRTIFWLP